MQGWLNMQKSINAINMSKIENQNPHIKMSKFSLLYKIVIISFCLLTVQAYKKLELTLAGPLMTAGNKLHPESVSV